MSFKVNDQELRDAVRSHILHMVGDSIKKMEEDQGEIHGVFSDDDREDHPFRGEAGLIERMVDNAFKNGMADAWKQFYEEHGFLSAAAWSRQSSFGMK